jgi:hypothetical protein
MKKILVLAILFVCFACSSQKVVVPLPLVDLPSCGSNCKATVVTGNVSFIKDGEIIENNHKTIGEYVTFLGSPLYIFEYHYGDFFTLLQRAGQSYEFILYSVGNVSISTYGIGIHDVPLWYIKSYEEVGQ